MTNLGLHNWQRNTGAEATRFSLLPLRVGGPAATQTPLAYMEGFAPKPLAALNFVEQELCRN